MEAYYYYYYLVIYYYYYYNYFCQRYNILKQLAVLKKMGNESTEFKSLGQTEVNSLAAKPTKNIYPHIHLGGFEPTSVRYLTQRRAAP